MTNTLYPLIGGALIGLSATLMLLFNGRITGISGILSGSLAKPGSDGPWRWYFLSGLLFGGLAMNLVSSDFFRNESGRSLGIVALAGLLVGFGTVMGSGCTSGHGICGVSRFSVRSLIATVTFMLFGLIAVQVMHWLGGSL